MAYRIDIAPTALEALEAITNRRTRDAIVRRIDVLVEEPEKQGNALRAELAWFMSVRAAGQRYRLVYRVDEGEQRVVVVYLVGILREGSRQDVYALAQRLVRRGLT
jgi:mRNA interferase RelE/StbE